MKCQACKEQSMLVKQIEKIDLSGNFYLCDTCNNIYRSSFQEWQDQFLKNLEKVSDLKKEKLWQKSVDTQQEIS